MVLLESEAVLTEWSNVVREMLVIVLLYPHMTRIGCAAHALNLLLKDIMALKTMDTLYKRAKKMVRYVKGQ